MGDALWRLYNYVLNLQVNANELFNTYCSDDVYPPEVQEVLTEIALKVSPKLFL